MSLAHIRGLCEKCTVYAYFTLLQMGVILLHGAVGFRRGSTCKHLAGCLVQNNHSVVGCCRQMLYLMGGRVNERRGSSDKVSCPVKSSVRTTYYSNVTTDAKSPEFTRY